MDVPSQDEFLAFIALANTKRREVLGNLHVTVEPSLEGARKFFDACWRADMQLRAAIEETPVWRWWARQPNFSRAQSVMMSEGASDPMAALERDRMVEGQAERAARVASAPWRSGAEHPVTAFRKFLSERGTRTRSLKIYADIAEAFRSYFADDDDNIIKRIPEVEAAMKTVDELLKQLTSISNVCVLKPVSPAASGRYFNINNQLSLLRGELARWRQAQIPKSRQDETLPERCLVWDLRAAMQRRFHADKPGAIFYLLSIEGVRRPQDKRTIERMLAAWREKTVSRPRQKTYVRGTFSVATDVEP